MTRHEKLAHLMGELHAANLNKQTEEFRSVMGKINKCILDDFKPNARKAKRTVVQVIADGLRVDPHDPKVLARMTDDYAAVFVSRYIVRTYMREYA